jgi:hypothetical protein
MKIYDNIHHDSRCYIRKFHLFWICYQRERAIFLRGPKTYGSPFISRNCYLTFSIVLTHVDSTSVIILFKMKYSNTCFSLLPLSFSAFQCHNVKREKYIIRNSSSKFVFLQPMESEYYRRKNTQTRIKRMPGEQVQRQQMSLGNKCRRSTIHRSLYILHCFQEMRGV